MGTHYGSIHVRTEERDRVRAALETVTRAMHVKFLLAPPIGGWTTCYPEQYGHDEKVARDLFGELNCDIFQVLLIDSDVFAYNFYRGNGLLDEYVSIPDYWSEVTQEVRRRQAGEPSRYADLLSGADALR